MALKIINNSQNIDDVFQKLKEHYPNLKIKKANKSTVVIANKKIATVVRLKNKYITVHGDINVRHAVNLILLIIGILLGIFGVIIIFPILWMVYAKQMKKFKNEVYNVLS
ncbi:MAG: hypothetical protein PHW82_10090 [Bacteroidales bacterium]|nr:hypothetical protein [Bacteroidales bacterium]